MGIMVGMMSSLSDQCSQSYLETMTSMRLRGLWFNKIVGLYSSPEFFRVGYGLEGNIQLHKEDLHNAFEALS